MCYSAQIWADWRLFRKLGGELDIHAFAHLIKTNRGSANWMRKVPKATRDSLTSVRSEAGLALARAAREANRDVEIHLRNELDAQTARLSVAEAVLASARPTKKASADVRIATDKISRAKRDLSDLMRSSLVERDSRMYPGMFVPVMVSEAGRLVVKPMRYQCRPAGKPAAYDTRYPGTYNARRDSLEGFWRGQFGHTHALLVVETFYENVEGPDGKNRVIAFTPRDHSPMLVACLWSHWVDPTGKEPALDSFAAITDEPEPEVAAEGHDRTIINIKPEHVSTWLNPDASNLAALYAVLDDKQHPFYEHELAA